MHINQSVIDELRSMFKEGATPSRLIQHIVARHPNEGNWHGLIQAYFREGFGVPIVRGLDPLENYENPNLRYAYLNEDVLHEMVQFRNKWDQEDNNEGNLSSWLDSLVATDPVERLEEFKRQEPPTTWSESWSSLNEKERNSIALTNSGYKGRTEMVHILARLVERLQQKIVALERNCHSGEPGASTTEKSK